MANGISRRRRQEKAAGVRATEERSDSAAPTDVYLTERQYCERYHLAPRTAQRWRVTGEGPPWVRLGPHKIVYRLSDVERWVLAHTYAHRADELSRNRR
jgi:predicted DNA-binding transcriptional regulator AlpA